METTENDIVLIHLEGVPLTFARIESILADTKPNWYHVKLLMLQVPLYVVTWILRDVYIDGASFTMDGKEMRLERVECPNTTEIQDPNDLEEPAINGEAQGPSGVAEVISFSDLKKKSS
jgi:hypothetical protein